MRKAEEIAKRYKNFIVAATEEEVVRIIKQIQIEAIDETVRRCMDNSKLSIFDWVVDSFKEKKLKSGLYAVNDGFYIEINKDSILQVADKLKKELE